MNIERSDLRAGVLVGVHTLWLVARTVLRLALLAVLVMLEPLLRVILVPLEFLSFAVTLVFGFMGGAAHFPKWGMLGFSVGCYLLYGFFVALTLWVSGDARGRG